MNIWEKMLRVNTAPQWRSAPTVLVSQRAAVGNQKVTRAVGNQTVKNVELSET